MRVLKIGDGHDTPEMPPLGGLPSPARLQRIAAAMRGHDLVLTYGWEAINAALAHTVFARHLGLPPLVHHEERADAAHALRRAWSRRLALRGAAALVVPGERLRAIALGAWQQPAACVRVVPPAIDLAPFVRRPRPDALPRLIKRRGERWLGAVGPNEGGALLDALGQLPEEWQLVCLGEGPAREAVRAAAISRGLAHRVHTPGAVQPADAFGLFDLIAFDRAPEPKTTIAAMAAGLVVAAPRGPDLAELLAPANTALLDEPVPLLAADEKRLHAAGEANRARARERFDLKRRTAALRAIYDDAMTSVPPSTADKRQSR